MNPLKQLNEKGQSVWLDYIRRSLITSGELNRLIEEDGVRGMTSNPTIFEKAIAGSADYDVSLAKTLARDPRMDIKSLFEALAIEDIRMATDVLRPLYDESQGADGYVSLEVSPRLANDTDATIREAKRLWKAVDRPNLMVKVPATREGIPAFEALIADGVNVNVTLMFSLKHYEAVAHAYIRGLERCKDPSRMASVASFFVSRVDAAVDKALDAHGSAGSRELRGTIAVANAKLAYRRFEEIFYGEPFEALRKKGARVQRPLWASTSTKNPEYSDVLYVDELIGPDTVNTLPPATLSAFRDHGRVGDTLRRGVDEARDRVNRLRGLGIDLDALTDKLQIDGVAAFAKSFEELLEALKKKRRTILSGRSEYQDLSLAGNEAAVDARVAAWDRTEYCRRLWRKDPTLWAEPSAPELSDRLGWLDLPAAMHDQIEAIRSFGAEVRDAKLSHVVLCGMGGSSLAPEVYQRVFGHRRGCPELVVLDSTHPDAVRAVADRIEPGRTLFIVSSKSGTTTETLSFFKYFWQETARTDAGRAGTHFVAITDPGTPLETLAGEHRFRRVFHAPADVGGRYSALSAFGLVPAAAIGLDVHAILDGAWAMTEAVGPDVAAPANPALSLGAAIGELALSGRDKLTIVTSPSLGAFPAWIEQLIAESTGKDGKGVVPVVGESLGPPGVYGDDRVFVHLATIRESADQQEALSQLETAGHPVIRIRIEETVLLGQEFFRWEIATAALGSVLGIHPFNQPDVQLAKDLARKKMAERTGSEMNWNDGVETYEAQGAETAFALERWLADARPGDYVALQAYLAPSRETTEALQALRIAVRDGTHLATTLGYGPRFLHSTGQLHKGGADNGLFVQFVDDPAADLAVPGAGYSFGELIRAQAMGDASALVERGRRVVRIRVGHGGLAAVRELFRAPARDR